MQCNVKFCIYGEECNFLYFWADYITVLHRVGLEDSLRYISARKSHLKMTKTFTTQNKLTQIDNDHDRTASN